MTKLRFTKTEREMLNRAALYEQMSASLRAQATETAIARTKRELAIGG